ncbi:MAG: hypothetical protein JOY57_03500 [Actinobacteria bacterium]|nr:hypothetical protein [Actinomycetota bacterium]
MAGVTARTEPVVGAFTAGTEEVLVVDGVVGDGVGTVVKMSGCPVADRDVIGVDESARPSMRSTAAVTTDAVSRHRPNALDRRSLRVRRRPWLCVSDTSNSPLAQPIGRGKAEMSHWRDS